MKEMELHPNYIRALEDKYSNKGFEETLKEAKNTHLYLRYKKVWNCKVFDGSPELEIINEEYREFSYSYYKYEGKIKNEFQVEQTFYFLNTSIDKAKSGKEIILDVYALKDKNPNQSLIDLYDRYYFKNEERPDNIQSLEDPSKIVYRRKTEFIISESIGADYGPEVICECNFDITDYDDRGGYNHYAYLEEEGPFKFLNPYSGEWDDVYIEYEDNHPVTYCYLEWKPKGRDGFKKSHFSEIYLNLKKHGKKMDEWQKTAFGINEYRLTKYISMVGEKVKLMSHVKFYKNHILDKFDTSKPEELKELEKYNEPSNLISSIVYMLDGGEGLAELMDDIKKRKLNFSIPGMLDEELLNAYFGVLVTVFWKVYNSYDDKNDFPADLFNDFAYLYYHLEDYLQGIQYCIQALEIQKHSRYYDTIGEGWEKLNNLDAAFEWYHRAYLFELEEDNFDFTHIFNYTNTAIKIKKRFEASEGINVLIKRFPEENIDDLLKDYESLSS